MDGEIRGKVESQGMNRSETRRVAFEFLYSLELQKLEESEYEEQIDLFLEANDITENKVKDYITDVTYGIEKYKEEIIKQINEELSEKWQMSRLSKVSIAILKLAVYEIIYKKLPYKVVINEAVELAKNYGDDNAPSFINGILASVIKKNKIGEEENK